MTYQFKEKDVQHLADVGHLKRKVINKQMNQYMKKKIHIGTSGWQYDGWKGVYYPENISNKDMLAHYLNDFSTVEINNTFYRLPEKKTLEKWADKTPDDFIFSIKASRYITHMKKLNEPEEALRKFFGRIDTISKKAGPILFQLPPNWKVNTKRMEEFLKML